MEEAPRVEFDQRRPSLFTLDAAFDLRAVCAAVSGAMFRHHGLSWWPHVVMRPLFLSCWHGRRFGRCRSIRNIEAVRRPAILMLSLVIAQLCLGFTAFLTRVAWGRDAFSRSFRW